MLDSQEILKLRVLLSFLNEDEALCTVTGLSEIFGEGKQKISRILIAMEKDGLIDRSDTRRPQLTETGRQKAEFYSERTSVVLNHLLYEGLDISVAEHDAYAWALYSSDETMQLIRSQERRYKAKYELRKTEIFDGTELCARLGDDEYHFPFLVYRESVRDGSNLSMANAGFEHPCTLSVKNGKGIIRLKPLNINAKSLFTHKEMNGRVRKLKYLSGGSFITATDDGECITFPADVLKFINIGNGMGQILHGSVCLKMQCSVGTVHMPESTAIFTIMI